MNTEQDHLHGINMQRGVPLIKTNFSITSHFVNKPTEIEILQI